MCFGVSYPPPLPDPWAPTDFEAQARAIENRARREAQLPPKPPPPLSWWHRDPVGALLTAILMTSLLLIFVKFLSLL